MLKAVLSFNDIQLRNNFIQRCFPIIKKIDIFNSHFILYINTVVEIFRRLIFFMVETFDHKKYKPSKNFYDSVNVKDKMTVENIDLFNDRKTALDKIVTQLDIIERQDSLQHIAGLSKAEREAYVKKLAKQLRIQQGLKDEEQQLGLQGF